MTRKMLTPAILLSGLLLAAALPHTLLADVKTREKATVKFEGMMGRLMGMAGGAAAKDGLTSSVAVKGARKASLNEQTGQIVDLTEEKVYDIDFKKKEFRVTTFAQMREQIKKAQADAEKRAKDMPAEDRDEMAESGKEVEITVDVKETGEKKSIAGHSARQVILTVTAHEKGKTLDESGGMVLTNEVWVGPRIAALNEVGQFDQKFFMAVYGDSLASMGQQFASLAAMYPSLQKLTAQMADKMKALDGTPLLTVQKTEVVKSAAAMTQQPAAPSGGLGGALARRMMGNKKPEQRSLLYTSTIETLSIDATATDADVAIPVGFKEKK
jgi:hypothetical protein